MADLRELCEQYSCGRLTHWRSLTQNRVSIIKNNFGINDDQIVAFYDSSAFENSKVGLAICESGIYYRNTFQSPCYLNWKQVRSQKLTYSNTHLNFGENSVYITSTDVETMAQMLYSIRVTVKLENFVEKTSGFLGFLESAANWIAELDTSGSEAENQTLGIADTTTASLQDTKVPDSPVIAQLDENPIWSIGYKGKTYGPYSTDEAKKWIAQNYDGSEKLYGFQKGMTNWELMSNLKEFSSYVDQLNLLPPLPEF